MKDNRQRREQIGAEVQRGWRVGQLISEPPSQLFGVVQPRCVLQLAVDASAVSTSVHWDSRTKHVVLGYTRRVVGFLARALPAALIHGRAAHSNNRRRRWLAALERQRQRRAVAVTAAWLQRRHGDSTCGRRRLRSGNWRCTAVCCSGDSDGGRGSGCGGGGGIAGYCWVLEARCISASRACFQRARCAAASLLCFTPLSARWATST